MSDHNENTESMKTQFLSLAAPIRSANALAALNVNGWVLAISALLTSHERGLIASRSDEPTVAAGFIPRLGAPDVPRRGVTPESGAVFSIVALRRRISWRIEPWLESHGYPSPSRSATPEVRSVKNQIPVTS